MPETGCSICRQAADTYYFRTQFPNGQGAQGEGIDICAECIISSCGGLFTQLVVDGVTTPDAIAEDIKVRVVRVQQASKDPMALLNSVDGVIIPDQQGRWWADDGGRFHKDCGFNTFTQVTEVGEPVLVAGRPTYLDCVNLADEATFGMEALMVALDV